MDEIISTSISSLNVEQLGQVHRMLLRQQEQLVERSQALGRQIDALRAARTPIAGQIAKLGDDMNFISARMDEVAGKMKTLAAAADPRLGSVVGDLMQIDAMAPGATLEARRT